MNDTSVLDAIDRMLATVRTTENEGPQGATERGDVAPENRNVFNGEGHKGHRSHTKQGSYIHRHESEDIRTTPPRDSDYASRSNIRY